MAWVPAAQQMSIGTSEVSVQGRVQNGVQGRVEVTQPEHYGVYEFGWLGLAPQAHAGEVDNVRQPADNEDSEHDGKSHGGFVFPQ